MAYISRKDWGVGGAGAAGFAMAGVKYGGIRRHNELFVNMLPK